MCGHRHWIEKWLAQCFKKNVVQLDMSRDFNRVILKVLILVNEEACLSCGNESVIFFISQSIISERNYLLGNDVQYEKEKTCIT